MPGADPEGTSRVTMIWPADLKEMVRERVGLRGLTNFVLDAVRAALDDQSDPVTRQLLQRALTSIATGEDFEDRAQTIAWLEPLPEWVDRTGWPASEYEGAEIRTLVQGLPANYEHPTPAAQVLQVQENLGMSREDMGGLLGHFGVDVDEVHPQPVEDPVDDAASSPQAVEEAVDDPDSMRSAGMCPNCMSPLVDGECWSCGQ